MVQLHRKSQVGDSFGFRTIELMTVCVLANYLWFRGSCSLYVYDADQPRTIPVFMFFEELDQAHVRAWKVCSKKNIWNIVLIIFMFFLVWHQSWIISIGRLVTRSISWTSTGPLSGREKIPHESSRARTMADGSPQVLVCSQGAVVSSMLSGFYL